MKYDLAVVIPARNEEFLSRTIDDVIKNKRGKTEVIAVLDGAWADPSIKDYSDLTILYFNTSIGQRAAINQGVRLSKAKYIMKLDAHCKVSEGFDLELIKGFKDLGDNVVQIPALYNLHAFNWRCKKCGNEWYQSPTPTHCQLPGEARKDNPKCDNTTDFERIMVWDRRKRRRSECYRFDTNLHFQYHREQMREHPEGDYVETMSAQGSCFVLSRKNYWDWNICDEKHGSWGQQGTEVGCKAWLSGNRLVTNRRCWYAHLFRTQGGDFGFPFPLSGTQVEKARQYSKDLFLKNKWDKQKRSIQWLIRKFDYPGDWSEEKIKELCKPTKGIIYYTDNQLPIKIAHAVQKQLKSIGLPIVSASLKPMELGKNFVYCGKRGYLTMFKQILLALENSTADIVYFCEHDVLYSPSHFDFIPPKKNVWYYNTNVWKVDKRGRALHYDCKQVSGIAVYRETAIKHYKRRIKLVEDAPKQEVEFNRYIRKMGFEPGTHNRKERVDDSTSEEWKSRYPIIDIRHGNNLSPTRWKKEQFRNKKYTKGWIEGDTSTIPGWKKEDFSFL